jgi:hypothetical protein
MKNKRNTILTDLQIVDTCVEGKLGAVMWGKGSPAAPRRLLLILGKLPTVKERRAGFANLRRRSFREDEEEKIAVYLFF